MVLKGSSALYTQLYDEFEDRKPEGGWNKHDRHDHTPEQIQWLIEHGCEYHKVTAEPGDLLLWDSVSTRYRTNDPKTDIISGRFIMAPHRLRLILE